MLIISLFSVYSSIPQIQTVQCNYWKSLTSLSFGSVCVYVQSWGSFLYTQQNKLWFREEGGKLDICVFCFIGERKDEWMKSTATIMVPLCTMAQGKGKGCAWENKIQPLQSGQPKRIPDNMSLLCFHDKPYAGGWGCWSMRTASWRVSGGHQMRS